MTDQTNENPGALAGATGAKSKKEVGQLHNEQCQIRQVRATHFWDRNANCIAAIPSIRGALA